MKYGKAILGALLIGVLAVGSGYGTYAYFTAQATSTNNTIQAGTVAINNGEVDEVVELGKLFDVSNAQPGQEVQSFGPFEVKNTGSLPMNLDFSLDNIEAIKEGVNVPINEDGTMNIDDNDKLEKYVVNYTVWDENADGIREKLLGPKYSFDHEVNRFLEELGTRKFTLEAGHTFIIEGDITLDAEAGNDYQEAKLSTDIKVTGTNLPQYEKITVGQRRLVDLEFSKEQYKKGEKVVITGTVLRGTNLGNKPSYKDVTYIAPTAGPDQVKVDKYGNFAIWFYVSKVGKNTVRINADGTATNYTFIVTE